MVEEVKYPKDSAGRLMIDNVPTALDDFTVGEAKKIFFDNLKNYETINYVYLVNRDHVLKGVISLRDLLRLPENTELKDVMNRELTTVHPHTDQERVVYFALKRNIKSVPVIDKKDKFLGIVPSDVILETAYMEAEEDLLRFAGIHAGAMRGSDDVMNLSVKTSLFHRLPWLVVGLIGGVIAAKLISGFESTLSENLILAAFIPLIVYTASAISSQMQAFLIRDVALKPDFNFGEYFRKQLKVIIWLAVLIGIGLWAIVIGLYQNFTIANVLGIALLATILSAVVTGMLIPYLFKVVNLDPANGSGPVGTIIQDLFSLVIYLSIASALL